MKTVTPIVANAGLYNDFIAAGLIWGLLAGERGTPIKIFFLSCVVIAGMFGAVTLKPTTLVLQTLPGAVALILVWVSKKKPECGLSFFFGRKLTIG